MCSCAGQKGINLKIGSVQGAEGRGRGAHVGGPLEESWKRGAKTRCAERKKRCQLSSPSVHFAGAGLAFMVQRVQREKSRKAVRSGGNRQEVASKAVGN